MKKYEIIYTYLKNEISSGRIPLGEKVLSENELSNMFNVSRITSKNALNIAVQRGLVERRAGSGTFVISNKEKKKVFKKTIALIFPTYSKYYGLEISNILHKLCLDEEYLILSFTTNNNIKVEKQIIQSLEEYGVDGYIINPAYEEKFSNEIFKLIYRKAPVVLVDKYFKEMFCPFVTSNNEKATFDAITHLFSQGHQEIGIITRNIDFSTTLQDRYSGVLKAYKEKNFDQNKIAVLTDIIISTENLDQVKTKIINFIQANTQISAIIAFEYEIYLVLSHILKELNIKIPQEISLISFDSACGFEDLLNPVSHLKQNEKEIALRAFDTLKNLIERKETQEKNIIDVDFIIHKESIQNRFKQ